MKGVKFVAGEQVTYVDFMFWEILDHMNRFDSALFNNMDNLKGTYDYIWLLYYHYVVKLQGGWL